MVKGSSGKVLARAGAAQAQFRHYVCAYFIDVTFVALPGQLARCRFPCRRTLEGVSGNHGDRLCRQVVPFIIYAEVKRRMKQVFLFCVGNHCRRREIVLAGERRAQHFWELVIVQLFSSPLI